MTVIIGANLTGLCTALALSKLNEPSLLIDRKDISLPIIRDGRAIALSYGSKQILEDIGIWNNLSNYAGKIEQIRVTDQHSPLFLHFNNNSTLGYLIESRDLQHIMYKIASNDPNITILSNSKYELLDNNLNEVLLKINSKKYKTNLLIAADGKFSKLRDQCNIGHFHHNYQQTAIVCTVKHEKPHNSIAQEIFLPSGPFAILPLRDQYQASIVWTETNKIAENLLKLDSDKFTFFLKEKFTDYLGNIEIISSPASYPLELVIAKKYYHNHVALIGDAAHSIHPIAGQGFNLAVRDIYALMQIHKKYTKLGLPLGCYQSLNEYQSHRANDNHNMAIITDSLNKLFSNNILPINIMRKLGLSMVNQIPSLKTFFMEYAMAKIK